MIYISFQQWCVFFFSMCFECRLFQPSFFHAKKPLKPPTDSSLQNFRQFWQEKWPFFDAVVNAVPKDTQVNLQGSPTRGKSSKILADETCEFFIKTSGDCFKL